MLRELWTKEVVNFEGRWHKITHAGINPLPVKRPIPSMDRMGSQHRERPAGRVADRHQTEGGDGGHPYIRGDRPCWVDFPG